MTRTWFSLPDIELFAVAGLWRPTIEWGDAYSMVMVDGSKQMAGVHDRMPTILNRTDWQQWTSGTPQDALDLCQACEGPLQIQPTGEPWHKSNKLPERAQNS
jgi:putative SOS response-associated peptidase YedK